MKAKNVKNLPIGTQIHHCASTVLSVTYDRGEIVARTKRSITIRWADANRPATVLYFNDPAAMDQLRLAFEPA